MDSITRNCIHLNQSIKSTIEGDKANSLFRSPWSGPVSEETIDSSSQSSQTSSIQTRTRGPITGTKCWKYAEESVYATNTTRNYYSR